MQSAEPVAMSFVVSICLGMLCAAPVTAMTLSTHDLGAGGAFRLAQYHSGCGGRDASPGLNWSAPPPGARSLVLTLIDQDVPPAKWSHWIVVDLPPRAGAIASGARSAPGPARGVVSNMGEAIYDGPCPPPGSGTHHYVFTVWALAAPHAQIAPAESAQALEVRLGRISIAHASLTGVARR